MSEEAVLAANHAFYQAFAASDSAAMEAVWARQHPVFCIHPGWPTLLSRPSVMASWREIFDGPAPPAIEHRDAVAHVVGDLAYVVCTEVLPGGQLAATNLFVREDGAWKVCHHQATPIARAAAVPSTPPEELN